MEKYNAIVEKSKEFALRIIRLSRYLSEERHEYVLSRQILRSGTSVGANIREATRGQSRADFYTKLTVALKEADETAYWLELLHESGYIRKDAFESMYQDCQELLRLLTAITRTLRRNP
jgi:four helix bundle protein